MRRYLWTSVICVIIGLYAMSMIGCMTKTKLAAEKAYYEAAVQMQRQQGANPLVKIIPAEKDKPIVMHNVASFTVFAPPLPTNGPLLPQYVHRDYAAPWLNVLGMAVPWFGAWGIVKAVADIPHVNSSTVTTTNTNSLNSTPTTYSNVVSGSGNMASVGGVATQATAPPTVVTQPAPVVITQPAPVIVPQSYPPK